MIDSASSTSRTTWTAAAATRCACRPAAACARPRKKPSNSGLHYVKQDGADRVQVRGPQHGGGRRRILDRNGVKPCEIDLFVSHQANRRIILSATEKLGIPQDKVVINIERFGNTTAGTIPLALNDAVEQKRLKEGDLLLLASVGAGFTVGTVLMRWGLKESNLSNPNKSKPARSVILEVGSWPMGVVRLRSLTPAQQQRLTALRRAAELLDSALRRARDELSHRPRSNHWPRPDRGRPRVTALHHRPALAGVAISAFRRSSSCE